MPHLFRSPFPWRSTKYEPWFDRFVFEPHLIRSRFNYMPMLLRYAFDVASYWFLALVPVLTLGSLPCLSGLAIIAGSPLSCSTVVGGHQINIIAKIEADVTARFALAAPRHCEGSGTTRGGCPSFQSQLAARHLPAGAVHVRQRSAQPRNPLQYGLTNWLTPRTQDAYDTCSESII